MKQKKIKRISTWITLNKEFSTFKAFRQFAWYNMMPGEVTEGIEIFEDTILKKYKIKRTERRLIIEKTYDMWEDHLKQLKELQLKLF